jgi:hypothetical protein
MARNSFIRNIVIYGVLISGFYGIYFKFVFFKNLSTSNCTDYKNIRKDYIIQAYYFMVMTYSKLT